MAQAMSNIFGAVSSIKDCETPQELWDFVMEKFKDIKVDYIKITRSGIEIELTNEGKEKERIQRYRDKY